MGLLMFNVFLFNVLINLMFLLMLLCLFFLFNVCFVCSVFDVRCCCHDHQLAKHGFGCVFSFGGGVFLVCAPCVD